MGRVRSADGGRAWASEGSLIQSTEKINNDGMTAAGDDGRRPGRFRVSISQLATGNWQHPAHHVYQTNANALGQRSVSIEDTTAA